MAKVQVPYGAVAGSALTDWTEVFVEARETWTGSWERIDYLEPIWAAEGASPRMPQAAFRYRYGGEQKREDASAFAAEAPLDLAGQFIRIRAVPSGSQGENPQPRTVWVGVVVSEAFDIYGTDGAPIGDQGVRAMGLEFLLDRTTIGTAWARPRCQLCLCVWDLIDDVLSTCKLYPELEKSQPVRVGAPSGMVRPAGPVVRPRPRCQTRSSRTYPCRPPRRGGARLGRV